MFDTFGGRLTDQDAVIAAYVVGDRLVEAVATNSDRRGIDDAIQGDDGNFRCATANIEHHRATCFVYRHAGADCGSHRLGNQVYFTRTGTLGRFADCAPFYLG